MEIVMYSLFYQKSQNPFKANRLLVIMRYIHCSVVFYQGDLRERFGTSQVADLELDTKGCRDESFGAGKAPSVTVFSLVCLCWPLGESRDAFVRLS